MSLPLRKVNESVLILSTLCSLASTALLLLPAAHAIHERSERRGHDLLRGRGQELQAVFNELEPRVEVAIEEQGGALNLFALQHDEAVHVRLVNELAVKGPRAAVELGRGVARRG